MLASALLPVSFKEQPLIKTAKIMYGKYDFFIDKLSCSLKVKHSERCHKEADNYSVSRKRYSFTFDQQKSLLKSLFNRNANRDLFLGSRLHDKNIPLRSV